MGLTDALVGVVIGSGTSAETADAHALLLVAQCALNAAAGLVAADQPAFRSTGWASTRIHTVRCASVVTPQRRDGDLSLGGSHRWTGRRDGARRGREAQQRRHRPVAGGNGLDWRDRGEVVAIGPSAAFRKSISTHLPAAALSVHAFDHAVRQLDAHRPVKATPHEQGRPARDVRQQGRSPRTAKGPLN